MAESRKARLRRSVNRLLHPLGLHLLRRDRVFEMEGVLARAAKRGVPVRTVIDVGFGRFVVAAGEKSFSECPLPAF